MGVEFLIAGSLLQAYGSYRQGKAEKKAANARAALEMEAATDQANYKRDQLKKLIASQTVAYAKSGVTLEGSPLLVMEETEREGLAEADKIERTGRRRAEAERQAGRDAFTGGLIGAGASLASAGYSAYKGGVFSGSAGNASANTWRNPNTGLYGVQD